MNYLADAHRDWHTVNGWDALCPLDCYDPPYEFDEQDYQDEEDLALHDLWMAS